jgi:hypothetical protein
MLKMFQMVYSQAGQLLFGDGQSLTGYVSSQGERDFNLPRIRMGHRTLVAWHRQCYGIKALPQSLLSGQHYAGRDADNRRRLGWPATKRWPPGCRRSSLA